MGGVSPVSGSGSGMLTRAQEEMRLPAPGNARGGADSIYRQHVCVASLCLLTNESGLNPWLSSPNLMKRRLRENDVALPPSQDNWRLEFLRKLLAARQMAHYECQDDTEQQISDMINSLIIN